MLICCKLFWFTPKYYFEKYHVLRENLFKVIWCSRKPWKTKMSNIVVNTLPADGLAPFRAKISGGGGGGVQKRIWALDLLPTRVRLIHIRGLTVLWEAVQWAWIALPGSAYFDHAHLPPPSSWRTVTNTSILAFGNFSWNNKEFSTH